MTDRIERHVLESVHPRDQHALTIRPRDRREVVVAAKMMERNE